MDVASHPRDRLPCLRGYQTVAAPAFASSFRELSSLPASRAHFPGAEAATLCSGIQQSPRGAQSLFPGQCGRSWAPFPAPLSRTRSSQEAGMGEVAVWRLEGSILPGETCRDIVCVCCPQWDGEGVVPLNRVQGSQMIPVRPFSLNPRGKGGLNLTGGSMETSQGVMDTESCLDAPSRAVSLKTNIYTSFLGLGDKNREGSLQSALFQGSCLAGSSYQNELDDDDSARGRSWTCLDLYLAHLLQHETGVVRLK